MDSERRPRLTPAMADVRRAVRAALTHHALPADGLVLVALSGGPDSLALAAALAFEAPKLGMRAGAIVVDHQLQDGSAEVAKRAGEQAVSLGLEPVLVRTVAVGSEGGPESAAREARYGGLAEAAADTGASAVLLGHTLDDQAETVLLGLARGSGPSSLHGMSTSTPSADSTGSRQAGSGAERSLSLSKGAFLYLRPLLELRRELVHRSCRDAGLEPWTDPQNDDDHYRRVRARKTVLPLMEAELGPGIAEALARTAAQLREDSEALDHFAEEIAEELADIAEAGISLPVRALASNPPALRQRLIRLAVQSEFHISLSRAHTLEIARLVTDWHGQKPLDLPGIRVERHGALLLFRANG